MKYYYQVPVRVTFLSLLSIIDNFIIASPQQLGIYMPERIKDSFNESYLYTHEKWIRLYEEFCVRKSAYHIRKHAFLVILCSLKFSSKNVRRKLKHQVKQLLPHNR